MPVMIEYSECFGDEIKPEYNLSFSYGWTFLKNYSYIEGFVESLCIGIWV